MSGQGAGQLVFFAAALLALAYPLGAWMSRVYGTFHAPAPFRAVETGFYRIVGTDPRKEQGWQGYARTLLVFSVVCTVVLYGLQRLQGELFLNPDHLGAVNGGLDAFTPAGGAVPLLNIFVGEVIFGGVGSSLYSMLFVVVLAVFVGGLMIGRTPEYLGKKLGAHEVKLAALGALFVPTLVLVLTALTVATRTGLQSVMVAALALAGSLAAKRVGALSVGTLRTDGPTFATLLGGMVVLTSGLMVLPALALGPLAEGLGH